MRDRFLIALSILAVTHASGAHAQTTAAAPNDSARAAARELAKKGDDEFASGRCARAITLWNKAEATFHAPTILLRIARCQALTGKVVEATVTLQKVAAEKLPEDAPTAFVEAHKSAVDELPFVQSRIATLSVAVWSKGVTVQPVIEIDERTMPVGRRSFQVDPGNHRVRVRAGIASWDGSITLDEGEARALRVTLRADPPTEPPRGWRYFGLTLGGVGLASAVVGAAFGVSATETSRELSDACGQRSQCPPEQQENIDRLQAHALAADITIAAGAALVLAGAAVIVFDPTPKTEGPRVRLAPVSRGAALFGSF